MGHVNKDHVFATRAIVVKLVTKHCVPHHVLMVGSALDLTPVSALRNGVGPLVKQQFVSLIV